MSSKAGRRAQQKRETTQARRAAAAGLLVVGTGVPLGAAVIIAPPADAAPFSVINKNDAGTGSLRAAIAAANAAAGADTITFGGTATSGVITLTTGEIEITDDVTITGPGAAQLTVDAGGDSRIFNIHPISDTTAQTVVISGLTLANGTTPTHQYYYPGYGTYYIQEDGGAILSQGAYYDEQGSLTLDGVTVTGSHGGNGGGVMVGWMHGIISDSTFSGNVAAGSGGAIVSRYDLQVSGTTITDNTASSRGGAVSVTGSQGSIQDSTISDNSATTGGGISTRSPITVDRSVVSGNTADFNGGGLLLYGLYGPGSISDTLVSGNSVTYSGLYGGANGGGLDISEVGGSVNLDNVTVVGNTATGDGGGIRTHGDVTITGGTIANNTAQRGGGVISSGTTTTLRDSIVANNTAAAAADRDVAVRDTLYDGPIMLDYTLVKAAPAAGSVGAVTVGSNLVSQDPQLSPLADNGGPTQTMKPGLASPVIDRGKAFGLTTDQRGHTRPVDLAPPNATGGDGSDMGAVELTSAAEANVVHNTASPVIGGSTVVGSTLVETSAGTWNPVGVSLSRQWLRNGGAIAGATGTSYTLTDADLGSTISLQVTASTSGYAPATATSMPAGPVSAANLATSGTGVIKGKLKVGKKIAVVPPSCNPGATAVRYQWLRSGKTIANATKASYKLKRADKGKKMSVKVTFVRPGYNNAVVTVKRAGKVKG